MTDRDIERWKNTDVIDTTAYGDAYFDAMATDIDAALDAGAVVVPITAPDRRPHRLRRWTLVAAAAALLAWFALPAPAPDAPRKTVAPEAPDAVTVAVATDLVPSGLDDLREDDDIDARTLLASALESDYGLDEAEEEDTLASGGSWMADLDDLTTDELALLVAKL